MNDLTTALHEIAPYGRAPYFWGDLPSVRYGASVAAATGPVRYHLFRTPATCFPEHVLCAGCVMALLSNRIV